MSDTGFMQVSVFDSVSGATGTRRSFRFSRATMTLRDLLRERIEAEVSEFNRHRPKVFEGLVQPEESERLLNGYAVKRDGPIDSEEQFRRACTAFERNGFLVIAGGRQVESLDEEIDLASAGDLEFFKLMPLMGG